MSIRDDNKTELAAQTQRALIAERRLKEAGARPDTLHRAVVFLLKEIAVNNRDLKVEATYFIETLDKEKANPEKLAEVETPAVDQLDPAADPQPEPVKENAIAMAAKAKRSKRFDR